MPEILDRWYVYDDRMTYGPVSWNEVTSLINNKQISSQASIKNESWSEVVSIIHYFHPNQLSTTRVRSGNPKEYDGLYLIGFVIFWIGFIALFSQPSPVIIFISTIIEIAAIAGSLYYVPKELSSKFANTFAILWTSFQILILWDLIRNPYTGGS